jgi:hypothetical protein
MVVRVDEPRHDDLAAGVDLGGIPGVQILADGLDRLALDEHVAFDKFSE